MSISLRNIIVEIRKMTHVSVPTSWSEEVLETHGRASLRENLQNNVMFELRIKTSPRQPMFERYDKISVFFLQREAGRGVIFFFTTERNGRKKTERGRKTQNTRTGGLNGLRTEAQFFLYFGLPPDVQKGCPFDGL